MTDVIDKAQINLKPLIKILYRVNGLPILPKSIKPNNILTLNGAADFRNLGVRGDAV